MTRHAIASPAGITRPPYRTRCTPQSRRWTPSRSSTSESGVSRKGTRMPSTSSGCWVSLSRGRASGAPAETAPWAQDEGRIHGRPRDRGRSQGFRAGRRAARGVGQEAGGAPVMPPQTPVDHDVSPHPAEVRGRELAPLGPIVMHDAYVGVRPGGGCVRFSRHTVALHGHV